MAHVSDPLEGLPGGIDSIRFSANGLDVHALAAGPTDGPLVLLLHGFPEISRSWRHQLLALASAGYRAVAPDQRGYGRTTKHGPYDIETLSADVAAMIEALGHERAVVVGHDWGGGVAWAVAGFYPQRVSLLIIANCPPQQVLARALLRNPRQLRKSRYMLFFQLPVIPERVLTADGARAIGRSLVGGSYKRDAFSREEVKYYQASFSEPGAATAALNWYRAALRSRRAQARLARTRVSVPTLIIWGMHDQFLGRDLVSDDALSSVFAVGHHAEIREVLDAGHFVQNESPEEFNQLLLAWLSEQQESDSD